MDRTFVMFKPDCLERGLLGRILSRFEEKGIRILAMKMLRVTPAIARQHYAEHLEKPFYPSLEEFITAAPVVATVMSGPEVVRVVREMLGATSGLKATPGTIRGDHSSSRQMNLVHASDSPESAEREIAIYFQPHEILEWDPTLACWLQAPGEA
jgi:nucleoside-diphosphate kinase